MAQLHRHDFGPSLLVQRCANCGTWVFNRGCAHCEINLCKPCFRVHEHVQWLRCDDYRFKLLLIGDRGVGKSCMLQRFADDTYPESSVPTLGFDFKIHRIEHQGRRIKLQLWDTSIPKSFQYSRLLHQGNLINTHGYFIVYDVYNRESFTSVGYWFEQIKQHATKTSSVSLIGNKCDARLGPPSQVLTANVYIQSGELRACTTNLSASYNEELGFPLEATVAELEECIVDRFGFPRVEFFSGDGSTATPSESLKDHTVLTIKCFSRLDVEVSSEEGQELAKSLGMQFFEVSAKTGQNVNEAFESMVQDILHQIARV